MAVLMGQDDLRARSRAKGMESFRGGEGPVDQNDPALKPPGHRCEAQAVHELPGAREGLHPF
eukprot:343994-Alexandrium_andersonii.AAC.1